MKLAGTVYRCEVLIPFDVTNARLSWTRERAFENTHRFGLLMIKGSPGCADKHPGFPIIFFRPAFLDGLSRTASPGV